MKKRVHEIAKERGLPAKDVLARLKAAGVDAKLVVKPGSGHGWPGMLQDMGAFADWFDEHMKASK